VPPASYADRVATEGSPAVDAADLDRARRAVSIAFVGAGFAFASWASRIPQVRDGLALSPGELGGLLLALAVGSLSALPFAGLVVGRFGEARTVAAMAVLSSVGMALAALGVPYGWEPVAVGLVLMGFGFGMWDVAMNVEGALVEQRLGRLIMSRLHAGFSIGTVAGSCVGAAMIALGVGVTPHLAATAVVLIAVIPLSASRGFLAHDQPARTVEASTSLPVERRSAFAAWTERRTLLLGVFVLCTAFVEGTGNDWLAVATIDGYGTSAAVGTVTFAIFLAAMTAGRWFGPAPIDRYGRVVVLRVGAAVAAIGLLLVTYSGSIAAAMVGAAIWGLGTSLGFPTGMSAAADDPRHAAARVSVVSSIGYVAFLAGPPLLGVIGDSVGTLHSLSTALALLALAALVAGAAEPLAPRDRGA